MTPIQIEDEIIGLRCRITAMERAIAKVSPELSIAYNEFVNEETKMLIAIQERRAKDAMPGRKIN